ncbi:hypothetical protein DL96DRAFT_1431116, partial [Flagelloscypha sp. PMI_526]
VTDGPSNHDPAASGGLKININEPLVSWFKAYRRYHGRAPNAKSSNSRMSSRNSDAYNPKNGSMMTWEESSITVGAATFSFNRTLRVPDDATSYALPAGLGTFPLLKAQDYPNSIPDYISQRGGYIMPLFQREAMWISIAGASCAIKISVGGINAITGGKQNEEAPKGMQDYVVGGRQPWIDGIATEPGVVRQFVAMKLGHGYTIEEQLSDTTHGGIQIDVFPTLAGSVTFHHNTSRLAIDKSPNDLNIKLGGIITLSTTFVPTLRDLVRFATPNPVLNVSYRENQPSEASTSSSMRIFIKTLTGKSVTLATLPDARMGIAAGGKISQKIYEDIQSPLMYDDDDPSRAFIHTVSTAAWEMITGVVCPLTPITPALYKAYKYPWFALYDEHLPTVQPSGNFNNVQSVRQLDNASAPSSDALVDPESPPDCAHHPGRKSTCIARPCGHPACVECFGAAVFGGGNCIVCKAKIEKHVGYEKPVPRVA